jgi:hypothetical protein
MHCILGAVSRENSLGKSTTKTANTILINSNNNKFKSKSKTC